MIKDLKALAYDVLVEIEQHQIQIKNLQQSLLKINKQIQDASSPIDKLNDSASNNSGDSGTSQHAKEVDKG